MHERKEKGIAKKVRGAVRQMLWEETYEWPPKCMAILYQPKRPQKANFYRKNEQKQTESARFHK